MNLDVYWNTQVFVATVTHKGKWYECKDVNRDTAIYKAVKLMRESE